MFTSFSHIYLPVHDVDASIKFYTENLGFKLLRKYQMGQGGNTSAYVELGDVLLELTLTPRPLPAEEGRVEPRIGLTVDNMDTAISDLRAKGVQIEREPFAPRTFWGRQAMIRDNSGYGVSLREWEAPDSPRFADWKPRHEDVTRLA